MGSDVCLVPSLSVLLTPDEFDDLGEYSWSLPTGARIGKRWRRCVAWLGRRELRSPNPVDATLGLVAPPSEWWLGEYVDIGERDHAGILWRRIFVATGSAAAPRRAWLADDRAAARGGGR